MSGARLTHIGLCVRDLEVSARFYAAVGFTETRRLSFDDPQTGRILGLPGAAVDLVYLERDGFRLELIGYATPPVTGATAPDAPRPMNRAGFTHLSFLVDDPSEFCVIIEDNGGRVLTDTAVEFDTGHAGVMALDPDGNRLELIGRHPA